MQLVYDIDSDLQDPSKQSTLPQQDHLKEKKKKLLAGIAAIRFLPENI